MGMAYGEWQAAGYRLMVRQAHHDTWLVTLSLSKGKENKKKGSTGDKRWPNQVKYNVEKRTNAASVATGWGRS